MSITIYELLIILTFIITTLMMVMHIVENMTPKLSDMLILASTFHCYHIKVYRNGKLLRNSAWIKYINHSVNYYELTDGILYIRIS